MITASFLPNGLNDWSALAINPETLILGLLSGVGIALLYSVLLRAKLTKNIPFGKMPRMFLSALLLFLVYRNLSPAAFVAALVGFFTTQITYFALLYRKLKRG